MIALEPPFRLATEADSPTLAVLNNEASHGLALHAWRQMAEPGGDAWSFGVARQAARVRDGHWIVVDEGAGAVAGLQAWPASVRSPGNLPAIFRPLVALEGLEPAALHINLLATLPEARGRGLGARLMQVAEAMARADGHPRLSLVVADANDAARRFYRRLGYRRRAARPIVRCGWEGPGALWLLLVRDLA